MMNKSSEKTRSPFLMPTFGALAFIVMLVMISYIGYRLDTIEERLEDRLTYQPPVATITTTGDSQPLAAGDDHIVYVPVYSHVYSMGGTPVLLETTLSIRNTDPDNPIVITSINYYDTKGKLIDEYIEGRLELGPLESSEVLVKKRDIRGGSGANFLVGWTSASAVHPPIVQAIMAGSGGGQDISFHSNGLGLSTRVDTK